MSKIIDFPISRDNEWNSIRPDFYRMLSDAGMPQENITEFLDFFRPIFDEFQFTHGISISAGDAITHNLNDFVSALHEHMSKLAINRFKRELEIYLAHEYTPKN